MKSLVKKYHDRLVKEAKQKEADKILDEQLQKRGKYFDITILYTLHTHPKFKKGAKLCREFYIDAIRNYFNMLEQWQCDGDDSHFWIMEERLRADGIDVDALKKEVDEMVKNEFKKE